MTWRTISITRIGLTDAQTTDVSDTVIDFVNKVRWKLKKRSYWKIRNIRVSSQSAGCYPKCRTAALGGHVARCPECNEIRISYSGCRNRHCPKCRNSNRVPSGLRKIRYYGIVASRNRPELKAQQEEMGIIGEASSESVYDKIKDAFFNPTLCPCCKNMQQAMTFKENARPPYGS